jgi:hypothetical protein
LLRENMTFSWYRGLKATHLAVQRVSSQAKGSAAYWLNFV